MTTKTKTLLATHTLSRGVPDGDSNEVRYLQEALDMIENFQRRGSRQEATEITLVERQKISSPAEDEVGGMREFTGEREEDEVTKNI